MRVSAVAGLVSFFIVCVSAGAQTGDASSFGSKNTYSAFLEYSNDSSHIVLGISPNRKFASLGVQYERRLKANGVVNWRYAAEFRPLILESDPTETTMVTFISPPPVNVITGQPQGVLRCVAGTTSFSQTDPNGVVFSNTNLTTCGRRWTFAQGASPFGTRVNFRPRHRLQPTASVLAGYMLSAKKIPIDTAGSYNFTFELGAGLEFYQTQTRSIRLEYQLQHFSNNWTAASNPGVDNGLFKVTYNFDR